MPHTAISPQIAHAPYVIRSIIVLLGGSLGFGIIGSLHLSRVDLRVSAYAEADVMLMLMVG